MRFGKLLPAVLALTGAAVAGAESAVAQTVKIGLINSNSGFTAQAGDEMEDRSSRRMRTLVTRLVHSRPVR